MRGCFAPQRKLSPVLYVHLGECDQRAESLSVLSPANLHLSPVHPSQAVFPATPTQQSIMKLSRDQMAVTDSVFFFYPVS